MTCLKQAQGLWPPPPHASPAALTSGMAEMYARLGPKVLDLEGVISGMMSAGGQHWWSFWSLHHGRRELSRRRIVGGA